MNMHAIHAYSCRHTYTCTATCVQLVRHTFYTFWAPCSIGCCLQPFPLKPMCRNSIAAPIWNCTECLLFTLELSGIPAADSPRENVKFSMPRTIVSSAQLQTALIELWMAIFVVRVQPCLSKIQFVHTATLIPVLKV